MLDPGVLTDLEELTLCSYCKQKFNDSEQCPKYLSCKHHFCLRCIEKNLVKGRQLVCAHCWKSTDLGHQGPDALPTHSSLLALANNFSNLQINSNNTTTTANKTTDKERKSENCHTHGMPLALWCATCCLAICRACASPQEHPGHQIKSHTDAKDQLITDVQHELVAIRKLSTEIQRLVIQQREFLIKVLEACVTLKTRVETDLQNGWSYYPEITEARETLGEAKASLQIIENPLEIYNLHTQLILKKQRLQAKYQEVTVQCQLDDLIGNSGVIFDFTLLKQALASINMGEPVITHPLTGTGRLHGSGGGNAPQNPILFLANYCMSQLYSRHVANKQQQQQQQQHHNVQNGSIEFHHHHHPGMIPVAPLHVNQVPPQPASAALLIPTGVSPSLKQPPQQNSLMHSQQPPPVNFVSEVLGQGNVVGGGGLVAINSPPQPASIRGPPSSPFPLYYFNIDVNGSPQGRIVIEVRPDAAPKMAKNFSVLATGEIGVGYKGCTIFQCWEGESVITGDFELNNGRGGRSIFEDGFFMPDDTKFPAVRGAVGMRRTQKRHDNLGMVGSQFRIILQEMRGFTGIFGHVVEGLDLVEKISTYGDQTGKPTKTILITKSGKL